MAIKLVVRTGPQGAKGATGDDAKLVGPTGPTGPKGPTGDVINIDGGNALSTYGDSDPIDGGHA